VIAQLNDIFSRAELHMSAAKRRDICRVHRSEAMPAPFEDCATGLANGADSCQPLRLQLHAIHLPHTPVAVTQPGEPKFSGCSMN
jgi:hypothetical protein